MASRNGRIIATKIYVGNLPETCRRQELLDAFEKYGKVTECDIVHNYAFVHMENADEAKTAVDALNGSDFNGNKLTVQLSTSKFRQQPGMGNGANECYKCDKTGHWIIATKIYVGNLPETCRRQELLDAFEKYGKVTECDIVRNYAFVHMESSDEAKTAVDALNTSDFSGNKLTVQLSTSKVRQQPGMGNNVNECYRCGKTGHWSRNCPLGPRRPFPKGEEPTGPQFYPSGAPPYDRYREPPMYSRDPYEPYYRERAYAPVERYRPYGDPYERAMVRPREPYYVRERDPYARPPPDYYLARQSPPPVSREYVRAYYEDRSYPLARVAASARY